MTKNIMKAIAVVGVFALCLLTVPALKAQPYVPSVIKVWGLPLTFPIATWDKNSGAHLYPATAEIASRANFGRVRFFDNGMMAYFPNHYKIIPDSFVYTIVDSQGDLVHVKVMVNPKQEAIEIRYTSILPWRER